MLAKDMVSNLINNGGEPKLQALGKHLLIELYGCDLESLKSVDVVREVLVSVARDCHATIVDTSFHEFNPFGVSGVVIISESHISIHTWPEHRYAAVDVFTCGNDNLDNVADLARRRFSSKRSSVLEVRRGVISHLNSRKPTKFALSLIS